MWAIWKLSRMKTGTALCSMMWTWCLRMTWTFTSVRISPSTWWSAGTALGTGKAALPVAAQVGKLSLLSSEPCRMWCPPCLRKMRTRTMVHMYHLRFKIGIREVGFFPIRTNSLGRGWKTKAEEQARENTPSFAPCGQPHLQCPCGRTFSDTAHAQCYLKYLICLSLTSPTRRHTSVPMRSTLGLCCRLWCLFPEFSGRVGSNISTEQFAQEPGYLGQVPFLQGHYERCYVPSFLTPCPSLSASQERHSCFSTLFYISSCSCLSTTKGKQWPRKSSTNGTIYLLVCVHSSLSASPCFAIHVCSGLWCLQC